MLKSISKSKRSRRSYAAIALGAHDMAVAVEKTLLKNVRHAMAVKYADQDKSGDEVCRARLIETGLDPDTINYKRAVVA